MLFFNESNADDFDGKEDQYILLQKYMEDVTLKGDDLVGDGNPIVDMIDLSTVELPAGCYNEDGTSDAECCEDLLPWAKQMRRSRYMV